MRLKSVLSALGIACALVLALDYVSFAATGKGMILGRVNKASKVTIIKRTTNGPAAGFVTKPGQPPFAVNRNTKVGNLNADLLDGKNSSAFATKGTTRIYTFTAASLANGHNFTVGAVPEGRYLATYSARFYNSAATSGIQVVWGSCALQQLKDGLYSNEARSSAPSVWTGSQATDIALSGSGPIDTANGNNLVLSCSSSKAWNTKPFELPQKANPVTITLTPIESATVTTGTG